MTQLLLSHNRRFQLWHYTVSHRQLLLRSVKDAENPTRVDVLFKSVKSLQIPTLMNELHVREATTAEAAEIIPYLHDLELYDEKVFLVWGTNFRGHVVSDLAISAEDSEDFDAPSPLVGRTLVEMWSDLMTKRADQSHDNE